MSACCRICNHSKSNLQTEVHAVFLCGFFLIQYTKIRNEFHFALAGLFLTFLYITFTIKDYKGEAEDEDDEDEEEEEYDEQ